jgi:hypothetical protein
VPQDWDSNIIIAMRQGDKMTVIGGPRCAHHGTWWQVEHENGHIGWVRELLPDKRLLDLAN